MSKICSKVTGLVFLTLATTVLTVEIEPVKALTLNGSMGIGGGGTIDEAFDGVGAGTFGDKTTLNFDSSLVFTAAGDFAIPNINPALIGSNPIIKDLVLSNTNSSSLNVYSNPSVTTFIDFGSYTISSGSNPPVTANLSFDLLGAADSFTRAVTGFGDISYQDPSGIKGTFKFNGGTLGTGFLNISQSVQSGSYQISLNATGKNIPEKTPEPTTIMSLLALGGLGLIMKNGKKDRARKNA